jgi:hypothetical protein
LQGRGRIRRHPDDIFRFTILGILLENTVHYAGGEFAAIGRDSEIRRLASGLLSLRRGA